MFLSSPYICPLWLPLKPTFSLQLRGERDALLLSRLSFFFFHTSVYWVWSKPWAHFSWWSVLFLEWVTFFHFLSIQTIGHFFCFYQLKPIFNLPVAILSHYISLEDYKGWCCFLFWFDSMHVAGYIGDINYRNFKLCYANSLLIILKTKHCLVLPPCSIHYSFLLSVEIALAQLSLLALIIIHTYDHNILKRENFLQYFHATTLCP